MSKREITPGDILDMAEYAKVRKERRAAIIAVRPKRRVHVGPHATVFFENYDTMLHQVHEMLFVEKGGAEQLADELAAYNPLIPKGNELVVTMLLEVEDPDQRARFLATVGGIENHITLEFDGHKVASESETDVERTRADGKTSSVHFLRFRFTPEQAAAFAKQGTEAVLAIRHPNYGHLALVPETVREEIAKDLG